MPATMTDQIYALAGDFERAKAWHCRALRKVGSAYHSPVLGENSYKELAVSYAKFAHAYTACHQLRQAEQVLLAASRDYTQSPLGWLQMGIVYLDSHQ